MEFEFDKEMDTLLRQAAREGEAARSIASPESPHLDADEISLFAENVLPAGARARFTDHLADCNRCRKILSGMISLDGAAESEIVQARGAAETILPLVPWYKRLFTFPQMAYAMGGLALLFSGIIAFTVLQNARQSQNSSVAQIEQIQERTKGPSGASSDEAAISSDTYSVSNSSAAANTALSSASPPPAPAAGSAATSSNMSTSAVNKPNTPPASAANPNPPPPPTTSTPSGEKQPEAENDTTSELKIVTPQAKPETLRKREESAVSGAASAPAQSRKDDNERFDDRQARSKTPRKVNELPQNSPVQNQTNVMPDSRNAISSQQMARNRSADRQSADAISVDGTQTAKSKAAETRTSGGRVFRLSRGAWYDADYTQQATTTIRRGSKEYKKLDSGLRSIAENIGGVVVIVWKGKAYRIQ
jgi:hypothetical protein